MQLYDRRALLFATVVFCAVTTYLSIPLLMNGSYEPMTAIGTEFQISLFGGVVAFLPSFVGSSLGFRVRHLKIPNTSTTIKAALLYIALSVFVLWALPRGHWGNGFLWGSTLWGVLGAFGICYGATYLDSAGQA